MELSKHLAELLAVRDSDSLFLTSYLDTRMGPMAVRTFPVFLRKRISQQERLAEHQGGLAAVREFRKNVCRIDEYLTYKLAPETRGCAIFSSVGRDFFKAIQFPVSMINRLSVSTTPNLDPLIELHQNTRHYAIVALDQQSGRILSVFTSGLVETADQLQGEIPGRKRAGGGSQVRFERHRQDLIEHFMRQLAERLELFIERQGPEGILLLGTQENLTEFSRHLSPNVARQVLFSSSLPSPDSDEAILAKAHDLIEAYEGEREGHMIGQLYDRLCQDYRAVAGPEDTLFQLQAGRLERLFIAPSFRGQGFSCSRCGFCFSQPRESCTYCQGPMEPVDLRDKVEKLAEQRRIPLEIISEPSFLDSLGGTGAFLRF